jgi:hypothetical protein
MGAPLARLEARTALRALYDRLPNLAPLPDQKLHYLPVLTADVLEHLQVSWSPTTRARARVGSSNTAPGSCPSFTRSTGR